MCFSTTWGGDAMPLFDTVLEQVEAGPATILDQGTTAQTGNLDYTVVGGENEGWHLFVRPGDYIYLGNAVKDGAIITEVVNTNTLKISKPIAANNTEFVIVRPTEVMFRPPLGVEWEIHNIVITPRIDPGTSYNLLAYPVEVWSTNDNKPKTLLFTSQNYTLYETIAEKPYLRFTLNVKETWITLKPTYMGWFMVRNCAPVRVDIFVNGIEKTVVREESGSTAEETPSP